MNRGKAVVTMAKKDIHPEFVESAKVRRSPAAGSQMCPPQIPHPEAGAG